MCKRRKEYVRKKKKEKKHSMITERSKLFPRCFDTIPYDHFDVELIDEIQSQASFDDDLM